VLSWLVQIRVIQLDPAKGQFENIAQVDHP
jgi:hypothetical protein